MSAAPDALPPGYLHVSAFGRRAVVRAREAEDVRGVLSQGTTLHEWAAGLPNRREYVGREFAYGVELPRSRTAVVVRHARHGGALQAITQDLWLGAGRAAHELAASVRLRAAGVPTPPVVGYAVYPTTLGVSRIDVLIEELPQSRDLAAVVAARGAFGEELLDPIATLLAALAKAGARHEDLNVKNVLMTGGDAPRAWAIDVDRVVFDVPRVRALEANLARLVRSARKWRMGRGLPFPDDRLAALARRARELAARR